MPGTGLRSVLTAELAVVAESGQYEANPHAERRLQAGDTLIVSGSATSLAELRDRA